MAVKCVHTALILQSGPLLYFRLKFNGNNLLKHLLLPTRLRKHLLPMAAGDRYPNSEASIFC